MPVGKPPLCVQALGGLGVERQHPMACIGTALGGLGVAIDCYAVPVWYAYGAQSEGDSYVP